MNIKNIKDFDKLINVYSDIENDLIRSTMHMCLESDRTINITRLNDIKVKLMETLSEEKYSKEVRVDIIDVIREVRETYTYINKARRSDADDSVFESLITDLTIFMINKRKSLILETGDPHIDSYNDDIQYVCDVKQSIVREELRVEMENMVNVEYDNNINIMNKGLMESVTSKVADFLNKIKTSFGEKHEKINTRDGEWLKENKKSLTKLKFADIELEVPSDINVTFAKLISRHDTFDKYFKPDISDYDSLYENIQRFEDKNGNLKNGLDNYFKTGNSRREVTMKKVSGDEAKSSVVNMVSYCEEFLSGKGYIDSKLSNIMADISNDDKEETEVTESYNSLFRLLLENKKDDVDSSKEDTDVDDTDLNSEEESKEADSKDGEPQNENEESKEEPEADDSSKILRERKIGVTVLMTIAEERYFDYIDILKGLLSEDDE